MEMNELTIEIPKSQIQERNNRLGIEIFFFYFELLCNWTFNYTFDTIIFRPCIGLLSFSNSQLNYEFQLLKCQLEVHSRYHMLPRSNLRPSVPPSVGPRMTSFQSVRPSHYHQPIPVPFGMASYEIGQPIFLPNHHQPTHRPTYHPTSYHTNVSTHIPFLHSNVFLNPLPVLHNLY